MVSLMLFIHLFIYFLFKESLLLQKRKSNPSKKRFDFAKLADEAVKDKEEISNSSTSLDTSSNKIDSSVSSTQSPQPAPAAITSGVSLLASNKPPYVLYMCLFIYLFGLLGQRLVELLSSSSS
jgi:hypothetical protein